MRRRTTLPCAFCLLVLPLLGPRLGAEEETGARGVGPELQARIDAAIEKGARYLQAQQRRDGGFPGFSDRLDPNTYDPMDVGLNALVVQTLAHSGVDGDDDGIRHCLDFCRFHYSGGKGSWNLKSNGKVMVYTASTIILALIAVHAPKAAEAPPVKRDRYGNPKPPRPVKCKLPKADARWVQELVDFLVENQGKPSGGWRYPGNPVGSEEAPTDLSNTQYAMLALEAAERCGFDVPAETWTRAAEYLLREQDEDGLDVEVLVPNAAWQEGQPEEDRFVVVGKTRARGWAYLPGHVRLPTGSMTCAGVTGLAIAKERLWTRGKLPNELSRRIDRGMLDGLAWLQDHFTVEDNPDPPNMWHYYYLYGLERTGAKTGVETIGRHEWYREGALHLLKAQTKEGGWRSAAASGKPADNTESAITQTCFALLFLERATQKPPMPLAPPALTGGG